MNNKSQNSVTRNDLVAQRIDVEGLMARIRREVEEDLGSDNALSKKKHPKISAKHDSSQSGLVHNEELHYLNTHWSNWGGIAHVESHRPIIGGVLVRFKRFILEVVWTYILKEYFEKERQFHINLVRHLNATAQHVDTNHGRIFWQLIEKIDHEIEAVFLKLDRASDDGNAALRAVELVACTKVAELHSMLGALQARLGELSDGIGNNSDLIRGLERTMAVVARLEDRGALQTELGEARNFQSKPSKMYNNGVDYLLLENRYRGSEEVIKERMRDYVQYFLGANGPVIEFGCGRGELLELLAEAGVKSIGIDLDEAMVARCQEKGLTVVAANCLDYIKSAEDRSIGGIIATQLIEHLEQDELKLLLTEAERVLMPGGKIILETINPTSLTALCRNYFRDPTHVWPLNPDTMRFLFELCGLETCAIEYRSPYPDEAVLKPLEINNGLPARWRGTLQELNDNFTRLNNLLFGYQDYCIIGTLAESDAKQDA